MKPVIRIAIVSYNSADELKKCILSAKKASIRAGLRPSIIVTDNNSKDESVKVVKSCGAECIESSVNLGFAKATNKSLIHVDSEQSKPSYYLVLNPDTVMHEDSIKHMLETLTSDPSIGAVGPDLSSGDNIQEEYYLREPSALSVMLFSTLLGKFFMKSTFFRNRLYSYPIKNKSCFVPQIPGACLLTTQDALADIGLLDEGYSIWFEDVEWSHRARNKKYKLAYSPNSKVVHEGGVSFDKWQSLNKSITFFVSMKTFFKKNKPLEYPFLMLTITLNSLLLLVIKRNRDQLVFLKGFWKLKKGELPN